jgi:hypothetical protein
MRQEDLGAEKVFGWLSHQNLQIEISFESQLSEMIDSIRVLE